MVKLSNFRYIPETLKIRKKGQGRLPQFVSQKLRKRRRKVSMRCFHRGFFSGSAYRTYASYDYSATKRRSMPVQSWKALGQFRTHLLFSRILLQYRYLTRPVHCSSAPYGFRSRQGARQKKIHLSMKCLINHSVNSSSRIIRSFNQNCPLFASPNALLREMLRSLRYSLTRSGIWSTVATR